MSRRRAARTPSITVHPPGVSPRALQVMPAGAWDGARNDLRELRDWGPSQGSAVTDNVGDLPYLRARVRDLLRNAPIAAGTRQTVRMGVVGTGLNLYPRVVRQLLQRQRPELTDAHVQAFETAAAELWWAWSDSTGCDIERSRRFRALTAQAFSSAWTDGDLLVIRRHAVRAGDILSLKLQFIEADRLSTPDTRKHDPWTVDGVERDADGAPVAYWVEDTHPGERFLRPGTRTWTRQPAFGPDGMRRVLHVRNLSSEDRIGAVRGLPSLAPVIVHLKQIARYSNSELMRNIVASLFTVFIESPEGAIGGAALAPMDPTRPPDQPWEARLEAGAIVEAPNGKKVTLATPPGPSATFDPFMTAMFRQLGAAVNVPYELIVRHFSASYSASRAAVNFAYEAFAMMGAWLEDDFVAPIYEWFLYEAVASGLLDAPGFLEDPVARRAYTSFRLQGPVAPQLDPLKEALAAGERMDNLLSTHEEETAKTTGGDWNDNVPQLQKERVQIREAGLDAEPVAERIRTEPQQPVPAGEEAGADPDADPNAVPGSPSVVGAVATRRTARRARRTALVALAMADDPPAPPRS